MLTRSPEHRGLRRSRLACALLALSLCPLAASAQEAPHRPTIAVVGTSADTLSPDLQPVQNGLIYLLQSDLVRRFDAHIVSRSRLRIILDELGMAAAELVDPRSAQRFGKAVGAEYLVLARLSRADQQLTLDLKLERVGADGVLWSHRVAGSIEDLPGLSSRAARALAGPLKLSPAPPPTAAAGPTPTLAVLDFLTQGAAGPLDRSLPDLADLLSAHLSVLGVPLVERQALHAVFQELGLSASGLVRPTDIAKIGTLLGAQRMLDTSMIAVPPAVVFDSHLVHPETGLLLASCRSSGPVSDVPALLQDHALKVAAALRLPIGPTGRSDLSQQSTQSLEAALHCGAAWRLGEAGRAQDAVAKLQQAVYLDPDLAWAWRELGRQYQALGDHPHHAEAMRRYFAAVEGESDPLTLARVARSLSDAEIWQHRAAESEAAALLALYHSEDHHGSYALLRALAAQQKFEEARRFCEELLDREDLPHYQVVRAWDFLLGWCAVQVRERPSDDAIDWELSNVARALDTFADGSAAADLYLGPQLAQALLSCSLGSSFDSLDLDRLAVRIPECLALANRITTDFPRGVSIPGRGWFVIGVLEYKRGRPQQAIEALDRCLHRYPAVNFDSCNLRTRVGPARGLVHYVLGRLYEEQIPDRGRAISAYQQALLNLSPDRPEARDASARLAALGGKPVPLAPWLRRVGGTGRPLEFNHRQRLAHWLRDQGYDLRISADSPLQFQFAAQGIQVLIWEGHRSDYPLAEQLRSYVAGGGNLLIALGAQPYINVYGPSLATTSQTMDLTLDWLLPAFGTSMMPHPEEASPPARLLQGPLPIGRAIAPASYSGRWFPLQAADGASLLEIRRDGADASARQVVAAASAVGLGKVAVVSLRDWFAAADTNAASQQWETDLLAGILHWFADAPLADRHREQAGRWRAARESVAAGNPSAAIPELDSIADSAAPSAHDARYYAACLLADRVGDPDGAARRFRKVADTTEDPWLARMADLRLGVLAIQAQDEQTALSHLRLAAGDQPDRIWAQAWIAIGDLRLAQGEYLAAARSFRTVADEIGHSEERFRALFGLASALTNQDKTDAALRIFHAIAAEFGKAPLPDDLDSRWPDPWVLYYPPDKRVPDARVADAVAAVAPRP